MKAIHALIVAVGLGLVGAILNFSYLLPASQEHDIDYFIAVKPDATVNQGTHPKAEDLETVPIPKGHAGNLRHIAVLCQRKDDLGGVEHMTVCRTLTGGSLLLNSDLNTPPGELDLGKNQGDMWICVDAKNFIPALVAPGDTISFIVAAPPRSSVPTPAVRNDPGHGAAPGGEGVAPIPDAEAAAAAEPAGPTEEIGPFTVLNVGNRLGTPQEFSAAHMQPQQPNVIGLRVALADKRMDDRLAKKLVDRLCETNLRIVAVILHSRKEGGK